LGQHERDKTIRGRPHADTGDNNMTYKIRIMNETGYEERTQTARTQKEIIQILAEHIERVTGDTTYINDEMAYLF
jgi:hypothetical protein